MPEPTETEVIEQAPVEESLESLHETEETETTTETPETKSTTEAKPALGKEDIAELAKALRGGDQPTAPKEYSNEELDKMFNVFQPQMDLVTAIREGDEKAAITAVSQLRDALIKQADTLAQYRIQMLREELTPGLQSASAVAAAREEEAFFKDHEDLVKHKEAVTLVFNDMKSRRETFPDVASANKAIADRTRKLLGLTAPAAKSSNGTQSGVDQSNNRVKPAALSNGSQASGSASSAKGNVFQDIHS